MPPYVLSEQDADWLGSTVLATVEAALGHAPAPQTQVIVP